MLFSNFIAPAIAFLGAAVAVFASPISEPAGAELLAKRGGYDVYDTCQSLYDTCSPYIDQLKVDVDVDVDVVVGLIGDAFTYSTGQLDAIVQANAHVDVDVDAVVSVSVKIMVELVLALSKCKGVTAGIWQRVDVFISLYLRVLAKINADICAKIAVGLPAFCVRLFISLKLSICVGLLGLLKIGVNLGLGIGLGL